MFLLDQKIDATEVSFWTGIVCQGISIGGSVLGGWLVTTFKYAAQHCRVLTICLFLLYTNIFTYLYTSVQTPRKLPADKRPYIPPHRIPNQTFSHENSPPIGKISCPTPAPDILPQRMCPDIPSRNSSPVTAHGRLVLESSY